MKNKIEQQKTMRYKCYECDYVWIEKHNNIIPLCCPICCCKWLQCKELTEDEIIQLSIKKPKWYFRFLNKIYGDGRSKDG